MPQWRLTSITNVHGDKVLWELVYDTYQPLHHSKPGPTKICLPPLRSIYRLWFRWLFTLHRSTWASATCTSGCCSSTTAWLPTPSSPPNLSPNLELGHCSSLSNWILDILIGRPQSVQIGCNISSLITINIGAPQDCVLYSLLYSLYTPDCAPRHDSTPSLNSSMIPPFLGV